MKLQAWRRLMAMLGAIVLMLGFGVSWAAGPKVVMQYDRLEDAAVAQARAWQNGNGRAKPLMSDDGKVIFPYGQSMPRLTCSPMRACDVEMEPGEKVNDVIPGDKANWKWGPSVSTENGKQVAHVIIQPRDVDLDTNMIITTNRRTYHIRLVAPKDAGVYLNRVGFYYPEDIVSSWESKAGREEAAAAKEDEKTIAEVSSPDQLDFSYRIIGDASFRPLRVYNDGRIVYMDLPPGLDRREYPAVTLVSEDGKTIVVNKTIVPASNEPESPKGAVFKIPKLFDRAELRLGDEKVRIEWVRTVKSKWWFSNGSN